MTWTFQRVDRPPRADEVRAETVYLIRDNWDDWGYRTAWYVLLSDLHRNIHEVGMTKIASADTPVATRGNPQRVDIPSHFPRLHESYFSLGQEPEYYENIVAALGREQADGVLAGLGDLARNLERFNEVVDLHVVQTSLLRYVSTSTVADQFHRILSGGPRTEDFAISFRLDGEASAQFDFMVDPESILPTNVHAIIGSNGVGKTRTLRGLTETYRARQQGAIDVDDWPDISNLVSVGFSAFDRGPDRALEVSGGPNARVVQIGLNRSAESEQIRGPGPMDVQELDEAFRRVLADCINKRGELLSDVFRFLETDPILSSLQISDTDGLADRIAFDQRSSGHKIVLLTLASLVLWVGEKSLVLIDEPESHLHPPLLASFTRALSWLMSKQNGLAILATHSPVVLQEVPRQCAWVLWSSGQFAAVSNPTVETFGESLGALTRDVFHLQVERSGYQQVLETLVERYDSYEAAFEAVGGQLGQEARFTLRGLYVQREDES